MEKIKEIRRLPVEEQQQILVDFNNTTTAYPQDKTVTDLFEEQVLLHPGHTAIVTDNGAITYEALNSTANQLAAYIQHRHGVKPGAVIAVQLKRSEHLIMAILAILKSGAIYMPVDNNMPEKRKEYIKADSGYTLLIDSGLFSAFAADKAAFSAEDPPRASQPGDVAYIIYTSGTTGQPKGTLIEHHSLVNRLCWMQKQYTLSAADTILQKTSNSFDVSVWELLWWAVMGAKVYFLPDGYERDPEQIALHIERYGISVVHFVPSMLVRFLDFLENNPAYALGSLQRVYASGEALTPRLNQQFHELIKQTKLVNLYGPTEATIDVTCFECKQGLNIIPIGKPIDNTRIYILDDNRELVPVGKEGRIFLAGAGLSRGYLNKPELTAQRFIADPFFAGERMYDTGDLGKWMPDGNIIYLGRDDDQVKIRGFRIEPGEISNTLESLQGVGVAHVLHLEEKLVAFIVPDSPAPIADHTALENYLRAELLQILPDYMLPHYFCLVKEIPVGATGKADKKQLARIFEERKAAAPARNHITQLTPASRIMTEIWSAVLGVPVEAIDPEQSFIEQGGDSLSMLKVVAMCKKKGYSITVKSFLDAPYVNFLDKAVSSKKESAAVTQGPFVLSPIQQFFFDHNRQGSQFLMHASYYLQPAFSLEGIRKSLDAVTEKHDTFRLRFKKEKGQWRQQYEAVTINYTLETTAAGQDEKSLQERIGHAMKVINIEKGPLLYAGIFFEQERPVLFLACHHLIMDMVSWKLFIEDLQYNYYEQL
ncbi:non-ribosomal peptide synthetase [Chitinophaga sp. GbtcB8]|uniref:non-ribosomal peptide synthetase n=1 Tax=Chitinophaga sp. GbtcB8 TaxID=2824753 RepID=UPI001C2F50FE|nr:non-ribosomal peptide synthetase [Chitinophaga sp. GbtcB8]